jgi:hypothetical protein
VIPKRPPEGVVQRPGAAGAGPGASDE